MSTDLIKQAMARIDETEKFAAAHAKAVDELSSFIDGVEEYCKEAQLDEDHAIMLWGILGGELEKQSGMGVDKPMIENMLAQAGTPGQVAPEPTPASWYNNIGSDLGSYFKQFKNPSMWGQAAAAGLGTGLASMLMQGLRRRQPGEQRPDFLKSFLIPALLGGAVLPYAWQKSAPWRAGQRADNAVAAMDRM